MRNSRKDKVQWEHTGKSHKAEGTELQTGSCSLTHTHSQNRKKSCKKEQGPYILKACFEILQNLIDNCSFPPTSLLEYNCSTMVCQLLLYNKVNQPYVYTYPHIPSLLRLPPTIPIPPLQEVSKYRADLPVLCGCFPLAIYFTFGSVYVSTLLSHLVPAHPSPYTCPQVHSPRLHLYSCPAPRFFRTIFFLRFHIYVLAHGICFSLSDLLHSV